MRSQNGGLRSPAKNDDTSSSWVHPTGGSLRVFGLFSWLRVGSVKMALSRPTHQRVTPAVSPLGINQNTILLKGLCLLWFQSFHPTIF